MTLEWDMLSSKQKTALKLALKQDIKMSMSFLNKVYSNKEYARKALKTYNRTGIVRSTDIGNKYEIVEDEIPQGELP